MSIGAELHSQVFRIKRIALMPGALTPVFSPYTTHAVTIRNETNFDVQVHTHIDETEYVAIPKGTNFILPIGRYTFTPEHLAFWLRSAMGGTVVLIWQ